MNEYITKDLGEAAALLTSNCNMKGMQWKDNKAYFVFNNAETCQKLSNQYFFEGLQGSLRSYYENLRTIKVKIYGELRARGGDRP